MTCHLPACSPSLQSLRFSRCFFLSQYRSGFFFSFLFSCSRFCQGPDALLSVCSGPVCSFFPVYSFGFSSSIFSPL